MSMLNHFFDYKPEVLALDEKALELCQPYFKQMEDRTVPLFSFSFGLLRFLRTLYHSSYDGGYRIISD